MKMSFIPVLEDILREIGNNSHNYSTIDYFMKVTDLNESSTLVLKKKYTHNLFGTSVLIIAYATLIFISLFGNSIVCYVIFRNRRMYTVTNMFIANMAISDLFVTCCNVPFNIARNMLDEWPFGGFLCHLVNYSFMVSVYVSTFTLTAIAIDRQNVLLYPLRPRMSRAMGIVVVVAIWIVSSALSLPYGVFMRVQEVFFLVDKVHRCRSSFPEPGDVFEKYLTAITLLLQYIIPLTIIAISYGRIVRKLWLRTQLGAVTQTQQISQAKAKKKSIKLLITVVVIFAMCWMPINLYHVLTDFHPDATVFRYDSTTFFILHWIAISSTCYNPFVYCWMNETFRSEVKSCFKYCKRYRRVHPGIEVEGILLRSDVFFRNRSKTFSSVIPFSSTFSSIRVSKNRNGLSSITKDETPLFEVKTTTSSEVSNSSLDDEA